ncbi:MAG: hypothetical protein HY290_15495 [Planctomycetia bacterium]|nr:hypothetical protein [Planctomycetia bacterium]
MVYVMLALAAAFASFCVWLTVRTVNRRERWAKRTAVAVVVCLPMLYVLSVGPVRRMGGRGYLTQSEKSKIAWFYSPLELTPSPIFDAIVWYARLWD